MEPEQPGTGPEQQPGLAGGAGGKSFLLSRPGGCSVAPVAPAERHPDTFGERKAVPKFLCRRSGRSLAAELGFAALERGGDP